MRRGSNCFFASILKVLPAIGLLAASPAHASIIYTNLGPGETWIINREYDVNSTLMATTFTTTGGGTLGEVLVPIFSLHPPATFGLFTDSNGRPGTLLESWTNPVPGFPGILTTLTSVDNPVLTADTPYWFVITLTLAQHFDLAWYQNNQSVAGGVWFGNSSAGLIEAEAGSPAPAIQLDTTPGSTADAPEPASVALLLSGLALLIARKRASNQARRQQPAVVSFSTSFRRGKPTI